MLPLSSSLRFGESTLTTGSHRSANSVPRMIDLSLLEKVNAGSPLSPDEATALGFEVENNSGKSEHGTILYFAQRHCSSFSETSILERGAVVESQQAILDELLKFKPRHIFLEGLASSFEHAHPSHEHLKMVRESCEVIFKDYIPGALLTERQYHLISMVQEGGAGFIYAYLNPEVTVHQTRSDDFAKRFSIYVDTNCKAIFNFFNSTGIRDEILYVEVEKQAMAYIHEFLKDNPREQVALVFGALHQFAHCCDSEEMNLSPQLYRKALSSQFEVRNNSINKYIIPR